MLQIYKQNKKLFLTLIEKSFTERPSPLEIREEDKYLEKETLEKLKREEIDEMVETDINNFISSLDGDDEDALVDKNIDTKRKEQLQILINYINASTAIQEKFATDYTKIDIQKLWSAFNIVREARKETQEVKKDVSDNSLISKALSDAKNEKNPQEKVFKENAILAKIWYLKLENNTLNVSKSEREVAIKSLQKKLWIKETWIFDEQTYKIFEETFNPSEVWKTPEIKSNQAPANPIQNGEKPQEGLEKLTPPKYWVSSEEDYTRTFEESGTQEVISMSKDGRLINNDTLQRDTNFNSLQKLLRKGNLQTIIDELNEAVKKDGGTDIKTFKFFSGLFKKNYNNMKSILEKNWYKEKWAWLESKQIVLVIRTIFDYQETQQKIPTMSDKDKFSLLVDFNRDGSINTDPNFYLWEAQSLYLACNSITTNDWINNVLENLWFENIAKFSQEMGTNLFLAREKFQRKIAVLVQNSVAPWELITKWWVKKALDKKYEEKEEKTKQIKQDLENQIDAKFSSLNLSQDEKRALVLEWINVVIGSSKGIWVNIDTKNLTKGFIDSLQVWLVNGAPWIVFSKELFNRYGLAVGINLINFVIPLAQASYRLKQNDPKVRELFQKEIKWSYEPSTFIAVTPWATVVWVWIERVDKKTSRGIEQMLASMKEVLIETKKDILAGKTFEESETAKILAKNNKNKQWANLDISNQIIYEEMQEIYKRYIIDSNEKETRLNDLMSSYLAYYKDQLFKNAKWMRVNSLSVWFALLWWFLPIPFLALGWERVSSSYKEVNHSQVREENITRANISPEKMQELWIVNNVIYKWQQCIKIIDNKYKLSSSYEKTFAEFDEKDLYIPIIQNGEKIQFTIKEIVTAKWVKIVIVLWEWKKGEKGEDYISTPYSPIESVNYVSNEKILSNTTTIRENIAHIFDWKLKKNIKSLQSNIFKALNREISLDSAWNDFIKTIQSSEFEKYLKDNVWAKDNLESLKKEITKTFTEGEKIFVLQAVIANLMKKEKFTYEWNRVTLQKNIKEYDKNNKRIEYFDSIFSEKFGNDTKLLNSIKDARKSWYSENGEAKSYTFDTVNTPSSIAFVWTESTERKKGLIPHMGVYNIAKVEWKKSLIPLNIQNSDVVINSLPDNFLESLKDKINLSLPWKKKLTTIAEVRTFIKDKNNFEYTLAFAKVWECLNDALIMQDIKIKWWTSIEVTASWTVYKQKNNVKKFWIGFIWPVEEKNGDNVGVVSSTPWQDEKPINSAVSSYPDQSSNSSSIIWGLWGNWQSWLLQTENWFNPWN